MNVILPMIYVNDICYIMRYGGFLNWRYPQIMQVINGHDLVLKPMVTWGSPISRNHQM